MSEHTNEHINESILSDEIKEHLKENRVNHMEYFDDMEKFHMTLWTRLLMP